MSRAEDPRPARTRAAILAAVASLSSRDQAVTVSAIVEEAHISRSAFYAQYPDLDALAVAVLSEAFAGIEELDLTLRQTLSARETATRTTTRLVEAFARNRALHAGVLSGRLTTDAHRAVQDAFVEQALGTMLATVPAHLDPALAARYIAGGTLAVLIQWIGSENPEPAQRIQQQLMDLLPSWLLNDERDPS